MFPFNSITLLRAHPTTSPDLFGLPDSAPQTDELMDEVRSLQLQIRGLPRRVRDWGVYKSVDERVVNMSTVLPLVSSAPGISKIGEFVALPPAMNITMKEVDDPEAGDLIFRFLFNALFSLPQLTSKLWGYLRVDALE